MVDSELIAIRDEIRRSRATYQSLRLDLLNSLSQQPINEKRYAETARLLSGYFQPGDRVMAVYQVRTTDELEIKTLYGIVQSVHWISREEPMFVISNIHTRMWLEGSLLSIC